MLNFGPSFRVARLLSVAFGALSSFGCHAPRDASQYGAVDEKVSLGPVLQSHIDGKTPLEAFFTIRNPSSTTNSIKVVDRSCGCVGLTSLIDNAALEPGAVFSSKAGAETRLKMQVRAQKEPGPYEQHVELSSSCEDGREHRFRLTTTFTILPDIDPKPPAISATFNDEDVLIIDKNIEITHNYKLKDAATRPRPEISGLPPGIECTSADLVDSTVDGMHRVDRWLVKLRLAYRKDAADLFVSSHIRFEDSNVTRILPISLRGPTGPRAFPELIYLDGQPGDEVHRRIMVLAADDSFYSILRVANLPEGMRADCQLNQARKRHWIDLYYRPTRAESREGRLLIELDHPRRKRLEVRINATSQTAARGNPGDPQDLPGSIRHQAGHVVASVATAR